MDDFIKTLEEIAQKLQIFFDQLLTGLLDVLERIYQWLSAVIKRVRIYLERLFSALSDVIIVVFKLSLFYSPGIICMLFGIFGGGTWLLFVGLLWIAFITIIALSYKDKVRKFDKSQSMEERSKISK